MELRVIRVCGKDQNAKRFFGHGRFLNIIPKRRHSKRTAWSACDASNDGSQSKLSGIRSGFATVFAIARQGAEITSYADDHGALPQPA